MSMKQEVNLLPWRLYAHRQKCHQMLFTLLAIMLATGIYHQIISTKNKQNQLQYHQLQRQQQHIEQQLAKSQQQLHQLRQQANPQSFSVIPVQQLEQILSTIQQFPLSQGELTRLLLEHNAQQLTLILQGHTSHQEFNAIEQQLHQQLWLQHLELTDFITHPDQSVQFELSLQITHEEANGN